MSHVIVMHDQCGDATCTRQEGPVRIDITWSSPDRFFAVVRDEGHPTCGQTIQRFNEAIERGEGR